VTHVHAAAVDEAPFVDNGPTNGPPDSLVLDIGGDVGALVLYADQSCLGQEVDLTPLGAPRSNHLHTLIRRRRAPVGEMIVGVYPEVPAGTHTIWGLDGEEVGTVVVKGGEVTQFDGGLLRG
jgi:hypothetical protein